MELSLVAATLIRRRLLIVMCAVLGTIPGLVLMFASGSQYESTATLSILPPDNGPGQVNANQPNRYVLGQIGTLKSSKLAETVASALNDGSTASSVQSAVTIEQQPETDLVDITARAKDGDRAQRIAQGVADAYIVQATAALNSGQQPEVDRLDAQLAALQKNIDFLNEKLAAKAAPYLDQLKAGTITQVPEDATLDPQAATERTQNTDQYARIAAVKSNLQYGSNQVLNSSIVQNADLPDDPASTRALLILIGGALAGLLGGAGFALISAQVSGSVLDEFGVRRVLGISASAQLPPDRALRSGPLGALGAVPASLQATIDQLCAEADAMASTDGTLTIAAVGAQEEAGVTSLALALASRYAEFGLSVLVVDANSRHPYLTEAFGRVGDRGLSAVLAGDVDGSSSMVDLESVLTPTQEPRIQILGQGEAGDRALLQRRDMSGVITFGSQVAQVVIIDAGAALGSGSAIQLCRSVDAVLLAIPVERQRLSRLRDVARYLDAEMHKVIAVLTSPSERVASAPGPMAKVTKTATRPAPPSDDQVVWDVESVETITADADDADDAEVDVVDAADNGSSGDRTDQDSEVVGNADAKPKTVGKDAPAGAPRVGATPPRPARTAANTSASRSNGKPGTPRRGSAGSGNRNRRS